LGAEAPVERRHQRVGDLGRQGGITLKLVALIKNVPDTEAKIKINADGTDIETQGIKFVMNPYDEYAVEQALLIKEQLKDGSTVTVVSLGPDRVVESLRTALAMGADEAIHVSDPAFEGGDSQGNARVLAEVLKPVAPDLVFCGKQGIDYDSAQTPPAVAEYLGLSQALIAVEFKLGGDGKTATVKRRVEGGDEIVTLTLPALVSCEKGLNEPRYASLPGIMKAKKKEIKKIALSSIGLDAGRVGKAAAQSHGQKFHPLPERPPVKMIPGEPKEQAKELVRLLRAEAKII
jgi:electron transfer flavoprotein beta subunit